MRWLLAASALILATALPGCGGSSSALADTVPDGQPLVVTQVPPRSAGAAPRTSPDPDDRYPVGSRVVLVDLDRPGDSPRLLSEGLAAAGAPAVAADGRSVLFTGRRDDTSHWSIWAWDPTTPRPRLVVALERDCIDPAYLGGDRIVFSCAVGPHADGATRWALHAANRDGSGIERITFGAGSAFAPTGLLDGRVLFVAREAPDATTALFTVNPDGTLLEAFLGVHDRASENRPRRTDDGGIVFLATDPTREDPPGVERVELNRPRATRTVVARPPAAGHRAGEVTAADPAADGGLLVATRRTGGASTTLAIEHFDPDGAAPTTIFDDPQWDEVEAIPLVARQAPRGRPSPVDSTTDIGTIVCYDSARSDGRFGPAPAAPPAIRFDVERARPDGEVALLGRIPPAADGSFFADVPADTPLRIVAIDAAGRRSMTSGWFWVRPGERRACFGCHESRDSAPVNRVVAALSADPVPIGLDAGEPER